MNQGRSRRKKVSTLYILPVFILLLTLQTTVSCRGPGSLSGKQTGPAGLDTKTPADQLPSQGVTDPGTLMSEMTLRQKIAQMFIVAARGGFYPEGDRMWQRMTEAVAHHEVGGIMFFSGSIYDQAFVTNRLQGKSHIPLWVSQDMEFGAAMRIPQATYLTPAMGIAATGNAYYAFQKGYITAKEASALGVHQIYAPVLDVNNNPLNPVINVRSYSEDPDTVARYGIAFMKGAHEAGVMATAKHFPGHGDTDVDSHLDLPVLPFDYYRLSTLELIPFRDAILAGLPSVMTAHIALPEIALNAGHPGTLDPYITETLLRDTLAFDGIIVTDGMGMRGIRNFFEPGEAAVLAVKAGIDQILLPLDLVEALDAVYLAVRSGNISEERINDSVRRILTEKINAGLFREPPHVDLEMLPYRVNTRDHRLMADHIAAKSVTLLRNERQLLPLHAEKYEQVTIVSLSDGRRDPDDRISRKLSDHFPDVKSVQMYPGQCVSDSIRAVQAVKAADLVIAVSHIAIRTAEDINLDDMLGPVMDHLFQSGSPVVAITLGTPYAILNMARADVHLLGWSPNRRQQAAVTNALLGKAPVTGRVPVSIPPLYTIGDGLSLHRP